MEQERRPARRLKVTAEAIVEILDGDLLEHEAAVDIDSVEFSADVDNPIENIRAEERDRVRGDPAAALLWLVDPGEMLPSSSSIELVGTTHVVQEVDRDDQVRVPGPTFEVLFPVCRCGTESCDSCSAFQLTPRTATVLWSVAQVLADLAYDDVERHGDDPVPGTSDWALFDELPRITWHQDAVWRRQAARAFDDLLDDLAAGEWPQPTCPAEEMALHLIMQYAETAMVNGWVGAEAEFSRLPEHRDDLYWEMACDALFQDIDILALFEDQHDGIEDPESETNQLVRMGDYRPAAWFATFNNMTRRDGRRSFRR